MARKNLVSLGTCIGKFTKGGKFHLQITALDVLAPYAKVRGEGREGGRGGGKEGREGGKEGKGGREGEEERRGGRMGR